MSPKLLLLSILDIQSHDRASHVCAQASAMPMMEVPLSTFPANNAGGNLADHRA